MQTSQTMCMITNLSSYLEGLNMLATYGLFALSISETFWDDWRSLSCSFLGWLNQWSNQKIHKTLYLNLYNIKWSGNPYPAPHFSIPAMSRWCARTLAASTTRPPSKSGVAHARCLPCDEKFEVIWAPWCPWQLGTGAGWFFQTDLDLGKL